MQWARLARAKDSFLTVSGFQNLKGEEKLVCTECGQPVAVKSRTIDRVLQTKTYFFTHLAAHKDAPAQQTCPLYKIRNVNFEHAMRHTYDPLEEKATLAVLMNPNISRFNHAAIQVLHAKLTMKKLDDKTSYDWMMRAMHDWGSSPLLRAHPYLLPYMAVKNQNGLSRATRDYFSLPVQWASEGVQYLPFKKTDERWHQMAVPAALMPMYERSGGVFRPMTYIKPVPVSLEALKELTQMPVPTEIERLFPAAPVVVKPRPAPPLLRPELVPPQSLVLPGISLMPKFSLHPYD